MNYYFPIPLPVNALLSRWCVTVVCRPAILATREHGWTLDRALRHPRCLETRGPKAATYFTLLTYIVPTYLHGSAPPHTYSRSSQMSEIEGSLDTLHRAYTLSITLS
jgi:hypothetical protein